MTASKFFSSTSGSANVLLIVSDYCPIAYSKELTCVSPSSLCNFSASLKSWNLRLHVGHSAGLVKLNSSGCLKCGMLFTFVTFTVIDCICDYVSTDYSLLVLRTGSRSAHLNVRCYVLRLSAFSGRGFTYARRLPPSRVITLVKYVFNNRFYYMIEIQSGTSSSIVSVSSFGSASH